MRKLSLRNAVSNAVLGVVLVPAAWMLLTLAFVVISHRSAMTLAPGIENPLRSVHGATSLVRELGKEVLDLELLLMPFLAASMGAQHAILLLVPRAVSDRWLRTIAIALAVGLTGGVLYLAFGAYFLGYAFGTGDFGSIFLATICGYGLLMRLPNASVPSEGSPA